MTDVKAKKNLKSLLRNFLWGRIYSKFIRSSTIQIDIYSKLFEQRTSLYHEKASELVLIVLNDQSGDWVRHLNLA